MNARLIARTARLALLPLTFACESATGPTGATEPIEQDDGALIRVAPNGREFTRVGDARRVTRMTQAPAFTDDEIADLENAQVERAAVRNGTLAEAPSGQLLDLEGKPVSGVLTDFDDGEYYAPPLEGEALRTAIEAYDARHEPDSGRSEDVKGQSHIEDDVSPFAFKSVRGSDGRTKKTSAERAEFPFSAILKYTMAMTRDACENEGVAYPCASQCTATLIDPDHATTAAHCVYSREDAAWIYDASGTRGQVCNGSGCVNVTSRNRSADYDDTLFLDHSKDYAVLTLSGSPPGYNGDFSLSTLDMGDGATIKSKAHYNYGYPADKSDGLWGMGCSIDYVGDNREGYLCDTSGGHSGGPVYYRNGDTRYQTAIHSGAAVFYNSGPNIGEIRDWIISLL